MSERKPFIESKTVWFVSQLIEAKTELALLRHLRGDHGTPVPDSLMSFAEKRVATLEQAFSEYRAKKEPQGAET